MSKRRVVVDGSNIATEGRALPSLAQLREAVAAWKAENADDEITVVVDASFSYRIEDAERADFEHSRTTGELVSPPAGAIGRGDGFLLQIADRVDAVVLSNDSFQEYHGEYPWLFERGRLVGGTPVPGVGWIFSLRTPVRGPKSRESIKEAKKKGRKAKPIEEAIAEATEDVLEPTDEIDNGAEKKRRRRRRSGGTPPPEAVNDPAPFIRFITTYKLGSPVDGVVDRFSSHGAFVLVDETTCYVPLTAMGAPPPRAAREVLKRGETREFVVQALDAQRRGVELALPGFARIGGAPTEETVEAEIREEAERKARKRAATTAASKTAAKAAGKADKAAAKATSKATGKATGRAEKAQKAEKADKAEKAVATTRRGTAVAKAPAPTKKSAAAKKGAAKKASTKAPAGKKATTAKPPAATATRTDKKAAAPTDAPAAKSRPTAKKASTAKRAATTSAPKPAAAAKKSRRSAS